MATEIRVPTLGESVTEATIAQWFKSEGEEVSQDEPLVELETDKVTIEVPAPAAGVLSQISVGEGGVVEVGALLGSIGEGNGVSAKPRPEGESRGAADAEAQPREDQTEPIAEPAARESSEQSPPLSPAVRKIVEENEIDVSQISGSGKGGRVTKGDALKVIEGGGPAPAAQASPAKAPAAKAPAESGAGANAPEAKAPAAKAPSTEHPREERVRMTRLRQTIARRLKDVQNSAAMLTTFNEVDMGHVMELRTKYKDVFERKHNVRLGFMGFFVKACITALKDVPVVNGEIDGDEIVYKNHYDIGVAVGTEKGLVVPVLRDADDMTIADIEKTINDYAAKARDGALKLEELQGGTFTISNGGVYGSLMSTPILNPPQSGILGMHKIEDRPVAVNGEVVVRPMMYLALSYDHRIVDGKEAVTFLVRIKECIEMPERLLLDL